MPPKRKTPTKKTSKKPQAPGHTSELTVRLVLFSAIIFMLTLALVFVWSQLPHPSTVTPETLPIEQEAQPSVQALQGDGGVTKGMCEDAGGHWVDCGNPCHGKPGEVCDQACEPQCECGGIAGWSCPKDFTCTDYEPSADTPDALGVCRKQADESMGTMEPSEPVREQPEGMLCDDLNFICVDDSVEGGLLTNPFTVSGSGIAFENTVNWRLLDGNGKLLEEGNAMANAPDVGQPGDFEIRDFILTVPETPTGTLEVLEYSAKDGSPTHVVSIPVRLPQQSMNVKFYLGPETVGEDCGEVLPVTETVVRTNLPVEATLRKLLSEKSGTIDQETRSGYVTNIPEGTRLVSLNVSGGTATVILSPELESYGGGSCRVTAIRAQIKQTLKQFSSVRNVVISVEGKTAEETLQP